MPSMFFAIISLAIILQLWVTSALNPVLERQSNNFVTVSGGRFQLDGKLFRFYGTNAYWLQMATDSDIDLTFHDIATLNFRVVRTWAFNDVSSKPTSGVYFQILQNGQATVNDGPDGLQRLDEVVAAASKYGVKLLLTLTNNWNPEKDMPSSSWNRRWANDLPRGYLSNDYGGIDLYVRNFHHGGSHDDFYTDRTIIDAFKNYLSKVIPRYANNPAILGWELGNDLRCSSTVPASSSCNTTMITNWVVEISNYIKTLDSNHLVTAGDGGFYCLTCPKLYAATNHTLPDPLLPGSSFDGSYGIDTEDILASPYIDFGSFQLFPDQVTYFPDPQPDFAVKAIGDGGKWVALHTDTARLLYKPEVLTAMDLTTKDQSGSFVPFNGTSLLPDGTPCRGVEGFQRVYAFTSWTGTALNGDVDGVLEYLWFQEGLTSHGTTHQKRQNLLSSPVPAHHAGPASGQSAAQAAANGLVLPRHK